MRKYFFSVLVFFVTVAAGLSFAQDTQTPLVAPLNPKFVDYVNAIRPLGAETTTDGHGLGYIPSPLDRSHLAGQSLFGIRPLEVLPASYDLRTLGMVTPVKNQRTCGDCWAFASMASVESDLLNFTGETWDFSEYNLNMNHGFDWAACTGGNGDMSTAYFARWGDPAHASGPLDESDDPYPASFPAPPYIPPSAPLQKHLQEVLIISARIGALDNDNLKHAVMTYGGVYTTYYASSSYYNKACPTGTCTTYYYSGPHSADHAVMIVGWDDNFPSTSFSPNAPGNGAFIIKNSWGTGWGVNGGYFYISYYDSQMGKDPNYSFNGVQPATNYIRAYQYDPLGHTSSFGYPPDTVAWFANVFTAVASEDLAAVSFYTNDVNVSYKVYIYLDVTSGPTTGSLAGTLTQGSITSPGYHTVTLSSPVSITNGQKFSVVIEVTNSSYTYPIPAEDRMGGYTSAATAGAGQSYISSNGTSWTDITGSYPNTNFCLKAFTGDLTPPADGTLTATPSLSQVSLSWSGFSDSGGSGLKSTNTYKVTRNTGAYPSAQCTDGSEVYLGTGTSITDTGRTNGTTYYYRACAYDNAGNVSAGATTAATVPVQITIGTSPSGLDFSVDASPFTTPQTYVWSPGAPHAIATSSPQSGGAGTQYVFSLWSDGGVMSHGITPASDQTIIANFATQYLLNVPVPSGGNVSPDCSSGCWYNSASSAQLLALPDSGYIFGSWGGDCSGTNLAAAPFITAQKNCTATFSACGSQAAKNMRSSSTFSSLQEAYGDTGTLDGDTIGLLSARAGGPIILSRNISVTISGGYDCTFSSNDSSSIITGSLTIGGDSLPVTVENLVIL